MVKKISVMENEVRVNKWPSQGDVFCFRFDDGCFGYGMVSLSKIDVGPFKNAIVIYIYNVFSDFLDESVVLSKEDLLLPPMITDNSCWKKKYFRTFKRLDVSDVDIFPNHYFRNPIRNDLRDSFGEVVTDIREDIPVGVESLRFYNGVIKEIERAMNQLF
ncbi:hypothetical protein H2Y56_18610 [Pectobacterium aroidearum]|uniref:Immunity protein 26 of polymorphic toxin system n=1 Tax=Pectobacterium aroidearum TaxID=1201031 RepID=A0ABR5ZI19_9GAMM|nr:Imm26 family immunity protein [Pectobacterium aroidearum]MBA5201396.1 hypothetical protein [Pectobacterium aroidearum]MBA5234106.1 hypothetical protein [Pectobacterium aroidearum]MBA5739297.1 hypothetical protein [Pectobacterium aroidearum]